MTIIKLFESPEMLAEALAERFLAELNTIISERGEALVALSGGSTPSRFYSRLAVLHEARTFPWQKVRFFWSDDRCVPPTHPESNFGLADKLFFGPLAVPESSVFRIKGEIDPREAALLYAEQLKENVPLKNGLPRFDIIFLGMGDDGHTASVFPHEIHLWNEPGYCVVATHPVTGQKRVSFTGEVINAAVSVKLLVTGAAKQEILSNVLSKVPGYRQYPVAHVDAHEGNVEWWLDSEAAALLPPSVF